MVNNEIRLIIFFAAKDGKALYSQQKQGEGQVVWDFYLLKTFPQFIVIYTVKAFGVISKAEVDVFLWNSLAFSMILQMLAI